MTELIFYKNGKVCKPCRRDMTYIQELVGYLEKKEKEKMEQKMHNHYADGHLKSKKTVVETVSKRKSVRIYISAQDIKDGCSTVFNCPLWRAIKRRGLLKGKCFAVDSDGIGVGQNNKIASNRVADLELSPSAVKFINNFDGNDRDLKAKPCHVTIIDPTGKYL